MSNCWVVARRMFGFCLLCLSLSSSASKLLIKTETNRNGKIIGVIMLMDWFNVKFLLLRENIINKPRPKQAEREEIISIFLQLVYHVFIVALLVTKKKRVKNVKRSTSSSSLAAVQHFSSRSWLIIMDEEGVSVKRLSVLWIFSDIRKMRRRASTNDESS